MSEIRVRLLGGFEVWDGDRQVAGFQSHRLVTVAPLSEEARRELMRLAAQAVAEETAPDQAAPSGPVIPMAGRGGAYGQLQEGWNRALAGTVHLTLVAGEPGIGKTRLIESFLDAATSERRRGVLAGRCHEMSPLVPYRPFLEILRGALAAEAEGGARALAQVPAEVLEDIVRLVPELRDLRPDLPEPEPMPRFEDRRRLFASVARFLDGMCRGGDPLVLFLDDLHLADRDTLDLLMFLLSRLEGAIWIVASGRMDELDRDHPLSQILRRGEKAGRATRLELGRLEPSDLAEIAESLVGESRAAELAGFLEAKSEGVPLAVTELVDYLWDEGILTAQPAGRWALPASLNESEVPSDVGELIRLRVRRLPNSIRRLATLAAILGHTFDVQLLQEAADEHAKVVEIGLEVMLEHRLIRRLARRGSFEFTHDRIRGAIYGELNPLRRQAMHSQVGEALESLLAGRECEVLAYHHTTGNQWEKSLPFLERSLERALAVQAGDAAQRHCDQAIEVLSRLAAGARSALVAERWRERREMMREKAAELSPPDSED
ncbi:MAG TPA: AAA family ATPase [Thermoanaerobaculia bacterium]|nr:AAA family ATPase [Thermoanaerobaculia bacterium]